MKLALLEQLNEARRAKRPVVVITDLSTGAQALVDADAALPEADRKAVRTALASDRCALIDGIRFLRPYNAPLRLLIVGGVHIAQSLVPMAQLAGYEVTVIDPRGAFASPERFEGVMLSSAWPDEAMAELGLDRRTAVVTLTHDPKIDDPALTAALRSDAFYIGALGSIRTHAARPCAPSGRRLCRGGAGADPRTGGASARRPSARRNCDRDDGPVDQRAPERRDVREVET